MKDILITSSVLILALLVIRLVFKKVLSRRVQYALWALVLVRLLVPVNLPAVNFSVLSAAEPIQAVVSERLEQVVRPARPVTGVPTIPPAQWPLNHVEQEVPPLQWDQTVYPGTYYPSPTDHPKSGMTAGELLALVWQIGMALMGAFFLLSNLWFWLKLRRCRQVWDAAPYGVSRKVYLVPEGVLPSPCLFLNAIYLTPAALRSEESLRHVLTHEETHARHLDPLWSFLRCLCLTVYWFDPLVWVAAACAKTDCELACDEAVLKKLGEAERIGYGQTLLSLIPVKRLANPLLSATTMTAGKRQLKDRITRIAQNPRQLAIAVAAVAVLALAISACTFAGGESARDPDPSPTPVETPDPNAPRSLTGEELRWFNEEFFNGKDENGYYRNQFVSLLNLYDRPEDIDLFELFYCDGEELTGEEYRILGIDHATCPYFKLTAEYIDAGLTQYTGLSLEQTNKVNFSFSYEEAISAYVWEHGDTNDPGDIEFLYGTRKGSTVKLYHHGWSVGYDWYCTTLEEQPDGSYWFVSNQKSEKPAIPTPLPAWEPETTISLSDLEPYVAPTVAVTAYPDHYSYNWETCYANWNIDGHHVIVYRAEDGVVYAAYEENDVYYVFQSGLSEKRDCVSYYEDLLGHRGFYLDYSGQYSEHSYGSIRDYYYFTGDGVLTLLARCRTSFWGEAYQIDWDGDGADELVAPRQLFFLRDGVVYEAQMDELLFNACPEFSYWDYEYWNKYSKSLYANGIINLDEFDWRQWVRYLY
ncbi:MAG: M56 family metallopeptidase, partial [Oscillospiraceae bacterium]|nr:M56 family metallopeptidase [Oscillospiraceae bacterium]